MISPAAGMSNNPLVLELYPDDMRNVKTAPPLYTRNLLVSSLVYLIISIISPPPLSFNNTPETPFESAEGAIECPLPCHLYSQCCKPKC